MGFKDVTEEHPFFVIAGFVVASFAAGWTAAIAVQQQGGKIAVYKNEFDEFKTKSEKWDQYSKEKAEQDVLDNAESSLPWKYFSMKDTGKNVAERLNQISPYSGSLVATSDTRDGTFHIWYRGESTGSRFEYKIGSAADLSNPPPRTNFFVKNDKFIPIGIGTLSGDVVPIYFESME